MLDSLRASKGGLLTWIFLGAIIVVFIISFGPGSLAKGGGGCGAPPAFAARVNGKTIPAGDFDRHYDQLLRFYQQQAGEAFTRELAAQLGLGQQALSSLVDRELTVQEAHRRGVVVSDAEVSAAVRRIPAFQENGQFRYDSYLEAVRAQYGSPAKFEEALRDDLLYQKMLTALAETVKVSEAEVRDAWRASADRTSLSFVQIPLAAAEAEVKISDDDAKAFADKEKDRIEKFYKENAARFDQKKKARVRHILAAAPQGADDGAAKAKIEAAAVRVKKGEDFGKVAQEVSDDANTKGRGGELGFVAEGLADEAFAKAALGLEKGQVSEPVRTPSGWHLLQVEEVVPARQVSLDAARTEIAKELLRKERAGKLARERAEAALEAAKKGKSLAELFPAEDAGKKSKKQPVKLGDKVIVPDETGSFGVGAPILPKLGAAPELARAAADAKAGEVLPKVYDAAAGPVIAVVKTRERPDEAAFAKERDATEDRLRGARLEQARRAWLASLRENAKIEENHALVQGAQRAAQPE
jgi:peptidyl-prolyl cis-trans isomerase D